MPTLTALLTQQASTGTHTQQVITATTTGWIVPANVTLIDVLGVGGGGSGAIGQLGQTTSYDRSSNGGGGGQVLRATIAVTPGESLTLTIGAGGVAPTAQLNYGVSGGDTVITRASNGATLFRAFGGMGGGYSYSAQYAPNGGTRSRATFSGVNVGNSGNTSRKGDDVDGFGGAGSAGSSASGWIYPGLPGIGGGYGGIGAYFNGESAQANTGGGGGGAQGYYSVSYPYAGNGGSGVLILDYDAVI